MRDNNMNNLFTDQQMFEGYLLKEPELILQKEKLNSTLKSDRNMVCTILKKFIFIDFWMSVCDLVDCDTRLRLTLGNLVLLK